MRSLLIAVLVVVACRDGGGYDGDVDLGSDAGDAEYERPCGDGVVVPPETCDPGLEGSCPITCNDEDPCTSDFRSGRPDLCDVACSHRTVIDCVDGDGCCPDGCGSGSDNDC